MSALDHPLGAMGVGVGAERAWTGIRGRPSRESDAVEPGRPTAAAARLGDRHHLLVLPLPPGRPLPPGVGVVADGVEIPSMLLGAPTSEPPPALVALAEGTDARRPGPTMLELVDDAGATLLGPVAIDGVELRDLARELLAGLDGRARAAVLAFLSERSGATADEPGGLSLSLALRTLRDALREPWPVRLREPHALQGANVDELIALDGRSFWIRGWRVQRDAPTAWLTAVSPEGHRVDLTDRLHLHPRDDLATVFPRGLGDGERVGFVGCFELPAVSRLAEGWILETGNVLGSAMEVEVPPVAHDPLAARAAVLRDLALDGPHDWTLTREHGWPAIRRLQARLAGEVRVEAVRQHGEPPSDPDVTVVVCLYKRLDFLEHQMAQWAHDPELAAQDLVYVLDSPEQAERFEAMAEQAHALYGVPFRSVVLSTNAGFSGANNAGAELGRGRLLLLLNSDVLPGGPGWLGRLAAAHDALDAPGAVGPKLVFEDGSLQHAGLYFARQPGTSLWDNAHHFKGLHRDLPAAGVSRDVAAVTGACLLVDRDRYLELGGLRGDYVQGDYEDSDFCLRLLEAGRRNRYVADVELYHLEGQSYPNDLRRLGRRFNAWLQTHLWGERIEALMAERRGDPAPATGGGR